MAGISNGMVDSSNIVSRASLSRGKGRQRETRGPTCSASLDSTLARTGGSFSISAHHSPQPLSPLVAMWRGFIFCTVYG